MNRLRIASLLLVAGTLFGCGGGGGGGAGGGTTYTGESDAVAVTADNAQPIGEAAAEASYQAVQDATVADNANPFGAVVVGASNADITSKVNEIGLSLLRNSQADQFPVGATYTSGQLNEEFGYPLFCGGSMSISDSLMSSSSQRSGTISYSNLCMTDFDGEGTKAYLNGSMTVSSGDGYMSVTYKNLTVKVDGEVIAALNGAQSCTWDAGTFYQNQTCTSSSYYACSDGKTYKIQDVEVSGDDGSGWSVNATFYHPSYGAVTVQATGVKFGCDNGHPSAGTITVTGESNTSVEITFTSCTAYTGTYTIDGGAVVSFSGW